MKGYIYLEDGTKLVGKSFGSPKTVIGELVFNTNMTGYQEVLRDPSCQDQVVIMAYPIIGNYGISSSEVPSKIHVKALIAREYCETPNHYLSEMSLDEYLKENNIPGVSDVDTRMLMKKIRNAGTMKCLITSEERENFQEIINDYEFPKDMVKAVSVREKTTYMGNGLKVGVVDLGVKGETVGALKKRNCHTILYPYNVTKEEIIKDQVNVLLFSSGPGDPKNCEEAICLAKDLMGIVPMWGIGLGQLIIALALGADTYKMKFGHRGANHPVYNKKTGKIIISSQNHGYAIDEKTLPFYGVVTHVNINDNSLEGFEYPQYGIKAVQFYCESDSGNQSEETVLDEWIDSMKVGKDNAKKR